MSCRLLVLSPYLALNKAPIFAKPLRTSWGITKSATPSELVSKLSSYMVSDMRHSIVHTLDAYITPSLKTVLELKTWKSIGDQANQTVKSLLHTLDEVVIEELNVISIDWVSVDVCHKIIALNR